MKQFYGFLAQAEVFIEVIFRLRNSLWACPNGAFNRPSSPSHPTATRIGLRFNFLFFVLILLNHSYELWAQEIRDVKPPVAYLGFPLWLILLAAVVALSFFAFRWFLKKRKGGTATASAPKPKPWDLAMERLARLKADNLPAQGKIKEYYTYLSDILRRYIEDRFGIRAPEMTTQEFLFSVQASQELSPSYHAALKNFLNCCDMVKFARYGSDPEEMARSYQLAEKFVKETRDSG